ncbi:MAG TPA: type II toxin-antitoxin system VapC family toxin [Tepidisphaeraceae bacterium]|jgi:PIN domain nuclease of toxin-antitoxin system
MPALIDTHTFLWLVSDAGKLSELAKSHIQDTQNRLLLSMASAWEIAIKFGHGRLELDVPLEQLLIDVPRQLAIDMLPIQASHLVKVASLPQHHRDPF